MLRRADLSPRTFPPASGAGPSSHARMAPIRLLGACGPRLPRLAWVLAAVVLVLNPHAAWGSPSFPGATGADPLLWVGRMVNGRGEPVTGTVSAQIRPASTAIPSRQDVEAAESRGLAPPTAPSVPLTSARTAPDGRFELRAVMPSGVPAAYTPGDWVHVLVVAEGADGSSAIATDAVRWLPPGGALPAGAWVSSLSRGREVERLRASREWTAAIVRTLLAADLADSHERPQTLILDEPEDAQTPGLWATGQRKGPGDPYRACTARYVEDRQDGLRTVADIDVGPDWSYRIDYQDTGTTSWEVGYERSQGEWRVAGTTSFSQSSSAGFNAEFGPYPQRFREGYQVQLVYAKVLWQCASTTSPEPFMSAPSNRRAGRAAPTTRATRWSAAAANTRP